MDDDGKLVCCGFFVSATRALTVSHNAHPTVGTRLHGVSLELEDEPTRHSFTVAAAHEHLDVVVLSVPAETPAASWFSIDTGEGEVLGANVTFLTMGIGRVKYAGSPAGEISLWLGADETMVARTGKRHFSYHCAPDVGGSGGALLLAGQRVLGMHLGGWNHVPDGDEMDAFAFDDVDAAAAAIAVAGIKRQRSLDRACAAGVPVSPDAASVLRSFQRLSHNIPTGGWALHLTCPPVAAVLAEAGCMSAQSVGT